MIDRVTPFPFPIIDADRTTGGAAASQGQGNSFMDLLARTLGKTDAIQVSSLPSPNPILLSPYPTELQDNAVPQERTTAQEGPMKDVIRFVLKQEGSTYVSRDGGKESSKFGVLQSTARGYGFKGSIKDLTQSEAEAIYEKMWKESGAAKLPRDLALVHFDTYINSPAAARKMLKASAGDTEIYLDLRAQRYAHLAVKKPARFAKYMKGWMNRVDRLRTMVAKYDNTLSPKAST